MGIGSKLSTLMKEKGTNANEVAQNAGIPPQTIYSLIRRDAKKVDIDSLIKIARVLEVNAEYFSDDYEPKTIAAHHDSEEWTSEELDEIEEFKRYVKSKRK